VVISPTLDFSRPISSSRSSRSRSFRAVAAPASARSRHSLNLAIEQETSVATNQVLGTVTSNSGTSLVVNVTATGGSGTHSDWTIVLTNSAAATGYQPPVGSGNVTGPGSSTDGHLAVFSGTSGQVIKDGGAPVGAANTITPSMLANAAVAFGVGMLNGTPVATVGSNALTIAVKTLAGADPSSSDPVFFHGRHA
jgi:hypothetical protein